MTKQEVIERLENEYKRKVVYVRAQIAADPRYTYLPVDKQTFIQALEWEKKPSEMDIRLRLVNQSGKVTAYIN